MAIKTATQRQALANAYAAAALYGAIYSIVPDTASGTQIGTRKALTWSAATDDGTKATVTATAVFDVTAGTTVAGAGVHSATTAGYLDGGAVTAQPFNSDGTYTATFTYSQT